MRLLLKRTTLLRIALPCVLASCSLASAQQLQWQHTSQQRASSAASTPSANAPVQTVARPVTTGVQPKRPTDRQPAALPANDQTRPIQQATATHETVFRGPGYENYQGPAMQLQRPADKTPRTFAPQAPTADRGGAGKMVRQSQWEEIGTPAPSGRIIDPGYPEMMYGGESGTCCGDGCSCGDSCGYGYGEPGCGIMEPDCGFAEPTCGCGDVACGDCCAPRTKGCVPIYIYVPPINEFNAFVGVQGFKSPFDSPGDRGNFGFHEGFNLGGEMSWIAWPGLAYQFGFRATQNQLGDDESHSQQFMTTGLFRRAKRGLQYGVVFDLMHDERQGGNDFDQIRGELGYAIDCWHDFGFLFAAQTNSRSDNNDFYHATDQYLMFYRMRGHQGGEFRGFAGFDDRSNMIIGSDFSVPLNRRWSLDGGWTYLNGDNDANGASANEGWNIGMSLVWHWGCRAKASHASPYRPLFNVADNGSMIITAR